jgi:hypothetical protein
MPLGGKYEKKEEKKSKILIKKVTIRKVFGEIEIKRVKRMQEVKNQNKKAGQ